MVSGIYERRVNVPEHVLVRELQGESVILNLIDEQYVGLDEVGTHMWQVFSGAASVGEAYRLLLDEYEVEPARLENDITAFLDGLLRRNLIEYIDT